MCWRYISNKRFQCSSDFGSTRSNATYTHIHTQTYTHRHRDTHRHTYEDTPPHTHIKKHTLPRKWPWPSDSFRKDLHRLTSPALYSTRELSLRSIPIMVGSKVDRRPSSCRQGTEGWGFVGGEGGEGVGAERKTKESGGLLGDWGTPCACVPQTELPSSESRTWSRPQRCMHYATPVPRASLPD